MHGGAPVLEVFASIQGEGAFVGRPQVFLRLRGCPLRCAWCDTPGSWRLGERDRARIEAHSGVRREPAWAEPERVAGWIDEVDPRGDLAVSLTGGEPLLWPGFLRDLRGLLGARRLHLETAGAHPRALGQVVDLCDHVSLDLKLPADLGPPLELDPTWPRDPAVEPAPRSAEDWRGVRRAVLPLVAGRDACAKLVVAGGREPAEFDELLDEVAELAPHLPLILQPASPMGGVGAPTRAGLEALLAQARGRSLDVRLLPQVHRLLGLP